MSAAAALVVEGVFLLRHDLVGLWDMSVWLDADDETIVSRATVRDAAYFGGSTKARHAYLTRLLPAQALHRRVDSPELRATLSVRWDGASWSSARNLRRGAADGYEAR
jgi:uridine kinase